MVHHVHSLEVNYFVDVGHIMHFESEVILLYFILVEGVSLVEHEGNHYSDDNDDFKEVDSENRFFDTVAVLR